MFGGLGFPSWERKLPEALGVMGRVFVLWRSPSDPFGATFPSEEGKAFLTLTRFPSVTGLSLLRKER